MRSHSDDRPPGDRRFSAERTAIGASRPRCAGADRLRHAAPHRAAATGRRAAWAHPAATALAHEAYARLVGLTRIEWRDRAHFFAAAAGAMRRVLIDYAAARNAQKRGSGAVGRRDSISTASSPTIISMIC